jgi:hypothetical protein
MEQNRHFFAANGDKRKRYTTGLKIYFGSAFKLHLLEKNREEIKPLMNVALRGW